MTDDLFAGVADRFKALSEPARLRILDRLRGGELTVGELGEKTQLNQANLSKHLQLLHSLEFVDSKERRAVRLLPSRERGRLSAVRHHVRPSCPVARPDSGCGSCARLTLAFAPVRPARVMLDQWPDHRSVRCPSPAATLLPRQRYGHARGRTP